MASRRSSEQCLTWLRSKAAEKDSLDGINAELCLNLIQEQKDRLDRLGAQFSQVKKQRDIPKEQEHLEDVFDPRRRKEYEEKGWEFFDF